MKKILVILIVFVSSTVYAQKGAVILGAYSNISDQSWTTWSLSPTAGVFVSDNFVIGTAINISHSSDEPYEDNFEYSSTYSLLPFVRFYKENLFLSIGVGLDYSIDKTENTNADPNFVTKDKTLLFAARSSVGYSLFWGNYVCFEPAMSLIYSGGSTFFEETGNDDINNRGPSTISFGLGLGLSVRLSK